MVRYLADVHIPEIPSPYANMVAWAIFGLIGGLATSILLLMMIRSRRVPGDKHPSFWAFDVPVIAVICIAYIILFIFAGHKG